MSWTVNRFSRLVRVNEGLVDPTDEVQAEKLLIAPNHIQRGTGRLLTRETAVEQGASSGKYEVRAGQVVYSKIRPSLVKATMAPKDCLCSADMYALQPLPGLGSRFLLYVLLARPFTDFVVDASARVAMPKVNRESLAEFPVAHPGIEEQQLIADYLDRETARIDELIAEQEVLTVSLAERRQALITLAVSRDSVTTLPLRRDIRYLTSGSRGWAQFDADEGARFIRIADLPRASIRLKSTDPKFVDVPRGVEGSRTNLLVGDLVFSITAYLGSVAVVSRRDAGAYVSQHVALCRLAGAHWDPAFVAWFCLGDGGQRQLNEQAYGGTKQQLALDDIRELLVPLPSLGEQRRIVAQLDAQTSKLDGLMAECRELIALLKERRAALITAAVTGKIGLRQGA